MARRVKQNAIRPNGCMVSDERNSSLAAWAKLVVRPQLGHGIPVSRRKGHGGSPNCSWVPMPVGEGCNRRAMTRVKPETKATAKYPFRSASA
jgi:hypothetical protein